jgi:hypothetical protein
MMTSHSMRSREAIIRKSRSFLAQNLPTHILCIYLVVGFCLYLIAPFDWKLQNTVYVSIYFLAMVTVFVVGFKWPLRFAVAQAKPVPVKKLVQFGTIAAVVLLIPATQLYSGKYPWQFMELLADQSQAYSTYLQRLFNSTQADRAPVAILRTIIHPLVFCVLPLTILNWKRLSWVAKAGAFTVVICMLITSLARGTDRESFDLLVFIGSCWLVNHARRNNWQDGNAPKQRSRTKLFVSLLLFFFLMVAVIYVFVERKLGRFGGNVTSLCIGSEVDICLTHGAMVAQYLSDWQVFAIGITAGYMSQGYYGLSTAMGLDFQSTWFTGFSPMIARMYESISGDPEMYLNSYTYRLRSLGWSDEYAWSTLMIWFANDVGFIGALVVLFLFSYLFGAAWRDAVLARDDRAAIVFVMLFLMFIYLPANNQIGQTLDLSFAFLFWLFRWRYLRVRPKAASARQQYQQFRPVGVQQIYPFSGR